MNYIIGVGGVGSWLATVLSRITQDITLIDGDTLEMKNLDRQLFEVSDVGKKKSAALAERLGVQHMPEFYMNGLFNVSPRDTFWCCVDNNRGRREVLNTVNQSKARALFAANETFSSEAYIYYPQWFGTDRDPMTYYPELAQDSGTDPLARSVGCTGLAQVDNPQLASANFMAAGLVLHLWTLHEQIRQMKTHQRSMMMDSAPHRFNANLSSLTTHERTIANSFQTKD